MEGKETQFVTDESGYLEIPIVNKIEIAYLETVKSYKIADSQTTELLIMVEPPTVNIDGNFLVKNGRLFGLNNENGAIEIEFKKIKNKFVKELFPEK